MGHQDAKDALKRADDFLESQAGKTGDRVVHERTVITTGENCHHYRREQG